MALSPAAGAHGGSQPHGKRPAAALGKPPEPPPPRPVEDIDAADDHSDEEPLAATPGTHPASGTQRTPSWAWPRSSGASSGLLSAGSAAGKRRGRAAATASGSASNGGSQRRAAGRGAGTALPVPGSPLMRPLLLADPVSSPSYPAVSGRRRGTVAGTAEAVGDRVATSGSASPETAEEHDEEEEEQAEVGAAAAPSVARSQRQAEVEDLVSEEELVADDEDADPDGDAQMEEEPHTPHPSDPVQAARADDDDDHVSDVSLLGRWQVADVFDCVSSSLIAVRSSLPTRRREMRTRNGVWMLLQQQQPPL